MKKIAISFLFVLILQTVVFSQTTNTKQLTSYLFDELTGVREDMSENERIERAVFELKKQPESKLAIVSYGLPGHSARRMNAVVAYHKKQGVSENRFVKLYGGYEQNLRFQLWIVPEGGEPPIVNAALPKEAYIFDRISIDIFEVSNDYDSPSPVEGFGKFLQNSPNAKPFLAYYVSSDAKLPHYVSNGDKFPYPNIRARKRLNEVKKVLNKDFGVKTPQIKFAGYNDLGIIELWVIPEGANPPQISKN